MKRVSVATAAVLIGMLMSVFSQEGGITVRIRVSLSTPGNEEAVTVTVGTDERRLMLDDRNPVDAVDFALPGPGTYRLTVTNITAAGEGDFRRSTTGRGEVELQAGGGEVFRLRRNYLVPGPGLSIVLERVGSIAEIPGVIPSAAAPETASGSALGAGEAETPTELPAEPYVPGVPGAAASRAVQPGATASGLDGQIRELELSISRMQAELSRLELFMSYYNAISPPGIAPNGFDPVLQAPWSFGLAGTSPSPIEGYRQYLEILQDELGRLRNGR